jgi:hypothetical protein
MNVRVLRRGVSLLVAVVTIAWAHSVGATPGNVYTVYFQQDTTLRGTLDTFFGCLAGSSTFGTTWAQQFSISPVTYSGSIVLQSAAPPSLVLGASLDQLMANAFQQGLVPPPKPGFANEYLVYAPPGTIISDTTGVTLCMGSGACGEHNPNAQYGNMQYDLAVVPLDCPDCGSGLDTMTLIGEHEVGEGLADLGTSPYEVGDNCEPPGGAPPTMLSCCGQTYTIQQLAGPNGPTDCQTINAIGSSCPCKGAQSACQSAAECCSGLACKPGGAHDGGPAGNACCSDLGATCMSSSDCCGALACVSGACACARQGQACTGSADCCAGLTCDTSSQTCTTPVVDAGSGGQPDAGSPQRDASFGGGSEAGLGGDSGGGGFPAGAGDSSAPDAGDSATGSGESPAGGCRCESAGRRGAEKAGFLSILLTIAGLVTRRRRARSLAGGRDALRER